MRDYNLELTNCIHQKFAGYSSKMLIGVQMGGVCMFRVGCKNQQYNCQGILPDLNIIIFYFI